MAVKKRADGRGRTGDLVLTMDALYQLSYVGTDRMVSLLLLLLLIVMLRGRRAVCVPAQAHASLYIESYVEGA